MLHVFFKYLPHPINFVAMNALNTATNMEALYIRPAAVALSIFSLLQSSE